MHAKRFKKKPYSTVADHFSMMHKKINFDMMLIEKNFDYDNISKTFAYLPIQYVLTFSGLTVETRSKGYTVDKPFMIRWLKNEYGKRRALSFWTIRRYGRAVQSVKPDCGNNRTFRTRVIQGATEPTWWSVFVWADWLQRNWDMGDRQEQQ